MSGRPEPSLPGTPGPAVRFVLLSLVLLCFGFPPETLGESAAGCAVLLALLSLLSIRQVHVGAATALVLALAASWPLAAHSLAPGAAPEALAVGLLAGVAGACAAPRARALRTGSALPVLLTALAAATALHALWQVSFGLDRIAQDVAQSPGLFQREAVLVRLREGRAFGMFATPAALGGLLALCIPVTAGLALECRVRRGRWLLVGALVLQGAALLSTASASAAGSLAAVVVFWLWRRGGWGRKLALGALAAFAVVVVFLVAIRGLKVVNPADPESPWRLRAGNVRVAAEMLADHPWTGVGPGAFGETFAAYRRPGDNESRHAHSLPFELLAEYGGVLGALLSALFLALYLGPLVSRPREGAAWPTGLAVGLAAFAVQNLLDFTAFFPSLLWGSAVLRGALARENGETEAARERGVWWGAPVLGVALLAGGVAALSGLAWNARIGARDGMVGSPDPSAALALSKRAVALAPWDVEARLTRAEALLGAGEGRKASIATLRDAQSELDAAVALSPNRPGVRALRARVRLEQADVPGAFADLSEACRLYPMREDLVGDRDAVAAWLPIPIGGGS